MTTTPPRRRTGRTTAAALVVAGSLAVLVHAATPAVAAPWTGTTSQAATITMATVGSKLELVTGSGSVTTDGGQYSISTVAGSVTGFVDLTNTSTVPATVSAAVASGSLVAATPASVCTLPWAQPAGTCPGTTTVLAQNGTFSSNGLLPAGGAVYLRVQTSGVIGAVTITMNPVVPRPAGDRTTS